MWTEGSVRGRAAGQYGEQSTRDAKQGHDLGAHIYYSIMEWILFFVIAFKLFLKDSYASDIITLIFTFVVADFVAKGFCTAR